jgi:hypothetical protein
MARDIKKRNQEIVTMSREGVSHAEIARQFRLSSSSIDLIVRKAEENRWLAEKNARILAEIRGADDLDQLWPTGDLFDVLTLPAATKKIILKAWEDKAQISLRDLMELAATDVDDRPDAVAMPSILRLRGIGKKNFCSFIDRMTNLDFGPRCNAEWQWRVDQLNRLGWNYAPRRQVWSGPAGDVPGAAPDGDNRPARARRGRLQKPQLASMKDVIIRRGDDYAEIVYKDPNIIDTRLAIGPEVQGMTEEEILDLHNECIRARSDLVRNTKYVAVEVPLGRPQIRYFRRGDQWVPRGSVLRCVIEDGADEGHATVWVDDQALSMDEFGKMLTTYAGWGMRIEFVHENDIHRRPTLEARDTVDE